jgi:hypothetical protein
MDVPTGDGPRSRPYNSLNQTPEEWEPAPPGRPCSGESMLLLLERWRKLSKALYSPKKGIFDISKVGLTLRKGLRVQGVRPPLSYSRLLSQAAWPCLLHLLHSGCNDSAKGLACLCCVLCRSLTSTIQSNMMRWVAGAMIRDSWLSGAAKPLQGQKGHKCAADRPAARMRPSSCWLLLAYTRIAVCTAC